MQEVIQRSLFGLMEDQRKTRGSQDNEKNRIKLPNVSCTVKPTQNIRELMQNNDAGTGTEMVGIRPEGVDTPIRESDNTKDLSRYNSADNIRCVINPLFKEVAQSVHLIIPPIRFDSDFLCSNNTL